MASNSQATIHLQTISDGGLWLAGGLPAPGHLRQQAMLWSMAKVAALEQPEREWTHSSALPLVAAGPRAHSLPFRDVHGPSLAAGVYLAPRLLPAAPAAAIHTATPLVPGAMCLVTGGTGALGLLLAKRLLVAGGRSSDHRSGILSAARVVLLGRSANLPAVEATLAALGRTGASSSLTVSLCDAATVADVAALSAGLRLSNTHLGCIFHAAGVLRDGLVSNQTAGTLRLSLAPKASAAANMLERLAALQPLPAFSLFSSIASLLGSGGQANYAAANAALDSLAGSWASQVRRGLWRQQQGSWTVVLNCTHVTVLQRMHGADM